MTSTEILGQSDGSYLYPETAGSRAGLRTGRRLVQAGFKYLKTRKPQGSQSTEPAVFPL